MVSAKLVHQIEDHWEAIGARLLRLLTCAPHLHTAHRIPDSEVMEMCRRLLHNLGHWLSSSASEAELAANYERVGRRRQQEGIPLSEAIRGVQLMRQATTEYIREMSSFETGLDLYAEEELEHRLAVFFDLLVYHLARGYEQAPPAR